MSFNEVVFFWLTIDTVLIFLFGIPWPRIYRRLTMTPNERAIRDLAPLSNGRRHR